MKEFCEAGPRTCSPAELLASPFPTTDLFFFIKCIFIIIYKSKDNIIIYTSHSDSQIGEMRGDGQTLGGTQPAAVVRSVGRGTQLHCAFQPYWLGVQEKVGCRNKAKGFGANRLEDRAALG